MNDLFTSPDILWQRLETRLPAEGGNLVRAAYALARAAHAGQTRFEGTPYIVHPLRVALLLAGQPDLEPEARLLAAALLHDVIEDCGLTRDELAARFGAEVADWVQILSKPAKSTRPPDWEERYFQMIAAAPYPARLVKLADRLDNLVGLIFWEPAQQAGYRAETRARILPIAVATDPRWAAELERLSRNAEEPGVAE
ncbi:MAG TPA: hypothetical protein DEP84_01815 [Chloroflexi bacterium]|nr:hypothetical protein [Chloroflexota bacterium]